MAEERQFSEPDKKPDPADDRSDIPTSTTPPAGFVPPEPAELAGQFPQLEILEMLGRGGMGVVYKARQRQLDRLVALKILPPQIGLPEAFAERFTREARSLARLSHPRIVMIYDFGCTGSGLYYFIMEFVDGTDLRRVIQTGRLSAAEALAIVPQICEALQYAHEEGIVHRDIKPENILLNKKGQVRIADFGLAKILDSPATGSASTLTKVGQRMGTPHYMAPEQIEHPARVDHRADIYSLGVVFYEMLTGELPLGRFAPPSQKARVDVRLDQIVLKALEKEPERRYQHASEVKTDVETIFSQDRAARPQGSSVESLKSSLDEAARRRVWIPAVGLLTAGGIDCLSSAGAVVGTIIMLIQKGFSGRLIGFLPGSAQLVIVVAMAANAVIVVSGAWNLMRLRSYRLAMLGSILAMLPFSPGAVIGLPMGIWALVVMARKGVKAAFGRQTEAPIGPKFREMAVSAAEDMKQAFDRGKAEADRLISVKNSTLEHLDANKPGKPFRMAFVSFILGPLSLLFASFHLGFAGRSVFVFLPAFFSILLGVKVMRTARPYRDHRLAVGLAIVGILAGLISGFGLLARMM